MKLSEYLPEPAEMLLMDVEIIGPLLLRAIQQEEQGGSLVVSMSLVGVSNGTVHAYVGKQTGLISDVSRALGETWTWLVSEGLLVPDPDGPGSGYYYVSRRGYELLSQTDFESYRYSKMLPADRLDPELSKRVRSMFVSGEYETAIFSAFKLVEVRVRSMGGYSNDDYGVSLMHKAFGQHGALTDKQAVRAERDAVMMLFAGCFGLFKNPASHRDVHISGPSEAAELILMANHLLRILKAIEHRNRRPAIGSLRTSSGGAK